eukprot:GEMP01095468.1.p1 GENE.GEMP01095468.1~~GEMP01095468.1.p1  ORF type:complete len:228 (-),score=-22.64 GEMP01095468.1:157-840(-)
MLKQIQKQVGRTICVLPNLENRYFEEIEIYKNSAEIKNANLHKKRICKKKESTFSIYTKYTDFARQGRFLVFLLTTKNRDSLKYTRRLLTSSRSSPTIPYEHCNNDKNYTEKYKLVKCHTCVKGVVCACIYIRLPCQQKNSITVVTKTLNRRKKTRDKNTVIVCVVYNFHNFYSVTPPPRILSVQKVYYIQNDFTFPTRVLSLGFVFPTIHPLKIDTLTVEHITHHI